MNASSTIRASFIRNSIMNFPSVQRGTMPTLRELEVRPIQPDKLVNFKPVNHIQHRENCERERMGEPPSYKSGLEPNNLRSFLDFDEETSLSTWSRIKKMYTVFPYRDPIYLVAIIFAFGSLDLVINALFDITAQLFPESRFETEEPIAIPSTVLIGSAFFLVAGILDTFGALNADRGRLITTKDPESVRTEYKPALIGSEEWSWIPSRQKFLDLMFGNLAFQAGLIVLVGGVIFMISGITDFPGIVPEESPSFGLVVFGPQVVHGAMFLVANAILAISEQEKWWKPKIKSPDWQGAVINTIGGFGFMMAGLFLFQKEDTAAAVAGLGGSSAFLLGSVVRWYVVMDIY